MNINRAIYHIDNWLLRKYDFALNFAFYVRLGHGWRRSWKMAMNTL